VEVDAFDEVGYARNTGIKKEKRKFRGSGRGLFYRVHYNWEGERAITDQPA
jgi:hypothetical protein